MHWLRLHCEARSCFRRTPHFQWLYQILEGPMAPQTTPSYGVLPANALCPTTRLFWLNRQGQWPVLCGAMKRHRLRQACCGPQGESNETGPQKGLTALAISKLNTSHNFGCSKITTCKSSKSARPIIAAASAAAEASSSFSACKVCRSLKASPFMMTSKHEYPLNAFWMMWGLAFEHQELHQPQAP